MTPPVKPSPEQRVEPAWTAPKIKTPAETVAPAEVTAPAETPENSSKPGRKTGQKAKEYDFTTLSMDLLSAPAAVNEELSNRAAPRIARDEKQVVMDKIVKQLHADWVAKEKPAAWAKMPKAVYAVDPKSVEGLKYLVDRAASFHGISIRYGKAVRDQNGRELVVFAARDRRPRTVKPDDNVDDNASDNASDGE